MARTCYRFKTKMRSQLNKAPTGLKLLGVGFSLHLLTTAFGPSRRFQRLTISVAIGGIADMTGNAAGSTGTRMTQNCH